MSLFLKVARNVYQHSRPVKDGLAAALRRQAVQTLFRRYLLRNCISSIMIFIILRFGQVILIGAAMSFLGLGARPPSAELG